MPTTKVRNYLDEHNIKYVVLSHSEAFTAQEVAHMTHVSGKEIAKVVAIKIHGNLALAVLPASYRIDFNRLAEALHTGDIYLPGEDEFTDAFPDVDPGAMHPFGSFYGMDVYVAKSLTEDEEIYFNAGTHTDLLRMKFEDFVQLEKPQILSFTDRVKVEPYVPFAGQKDAAAGSA